MKIMKMTIQINKKKMINFYLSFKILQLMLMNAKNSIEILLLSQIGFNHR